MRSKHQAPEVMVFKPSMEEFQDFGNFIKYIESKGAHKAGVTKIIPPAEWVPRQASYSDDDVMNITIDNPIKQVMTNAKGEFGIIKQSNVPVKPMTVAEYKKMAESDDYKTPIHSDFKSLERKYWKNIIYNSPIYGAGVPKTLFDNNVKTWNISQLYTILDYLWDKDKRVIEGINTPYLYFGMWKSSFAWHTEDMDLYSISYLHEGDPKTWYVIPPEYGRQFEQLIAKLFPDEAASCPAFIRHKMIILLPQILNKYSIPFNTVTQKRGEFIITFPYSYHCGFNHGFNVAEAINFASSRWVEFGMRASECNCKQIPVKFSMDTFVKYFRPDQYTMWLEKKNLMIHTQDFTSTFICNKRNADCLFDVVPNSCQHKNKVLKNVNKSSPKNDEENVTPDVWLDDNRMVPVTQPLSKEAIPRKFRDLVNDYCTFEIEQQYNIFRGLKDPHCSLCLMFNNKNLSLSFDLDWKTKAVVSMLPPLLNLPLPSKAFFKYVVDDTNENSQRGGLIRCVKCYVTVHKKCYDISQDIKETAWLCDRCDKNKLDSVCAYCPMKGGVMKVIQNHVWAHPECHLLAKDESSINVHKCIVCNLSSGKRCRCSTDNCNTWFHISCGILAGLSFQIDVQNTNKILPHCITHSSNENVEMKKKKLKTQ